MFLRVCPIFSLTKVFRKFKRFMPNKNLACPELLIKGFRKRIIVGWKNFCFGIGWHKCCLDPNYQCKSRFSIICLHSINFKLFGTTNMCHFCFGNVLDQNQWTRCILGSHGWTDSWTNQVKNLHTFWPQIYKLLLIIAR